MSTTVLLVKIVKKDAESDSSFRMRRKLYKGSIDKHNQMVFSTLKTREQRLKFVGKEYRKVRYMQNTGVITCFEENILSRGPNGSELPVNWNPYFDSGFDIFQPLGKMHSYITPAGETKSYELEIGTHLIGLGLKTAMYSIPILERSNLKAELLRRITIYNNLNNITEESLGDYSTKRFNMIQKFDWPHQTPVPFKLHPRSSIYKKAIRQANCTGIIDSGYRGELCAAVDCLSQTYGKQTDPDRRVLEHNKRYFQICRADLQPFYVVLLRGDDELPSTTRGEGGFGSTGQ